MQLCRKEPQGEMMSQWCSPGGERSKISKWWCNQPVYQLIYRSQPKMKGMNMIEFPANSTAPLRDYFNQNKDKVRFLVLLSPTWSKWFDKGARAVQKSVLKAFPDADICVGIVWIKMNAKDDMTAAKKALQDFKDERIIHFYDSQQSSGKLIWLTLVKKKYQFLPLFF